MPAFREDDDAGGFDGDYDGGGDDGDDGDSIKAKHRHMVGRTISTGGKRRQARNLEGSTPGVRLRRTGSLAMMMMMLTKMMTMMMKTKMKKIMRMIKTRVKDF